MKIYYFDDRIEFWKVNKGYWILPDNLILTVALKYRDQNPIMLTSDNGLQVKTKGLGITTITLKEFLKHPR